MHDIHKGEWEMGIKDQTKLAKNNQTGEWEMEI